MKFGTGGKASVLYSRGARFEFHPEHTEDLGYGFSWFSSAPAREYL
jgi:hypothetical protein